MKLKSRAKINLTLDVLYKREDGYHEVKMIMQEIELADNIYFRKCDQLKVNCLHPFVPNGSSNLVYKAVELVKRKTGVNKGISIEIEKKIPVAAGLGGGSSNAATTILGLNKLWNLGLNVKQMESIAGELGADVPFFIQGGTQLATGTGKDLTIINKAPALWVVLAKPNLGVSTKEVYQNLSIGNISNHPDTSNMLNAIRQQDKKGICTYLGNVLELVTLHRYSNVKILKNKICEMGANGALMSGSGPTVFGLCEEYEKAIQIAKGLGPLSEEVFVTKFV
ncbi:4-(cytidine 5'-diphospho)-2-C-methyl-D-erythritol kinase [Proteinivorax hydrogeniformans]|uniref:4-diphosphocytidyl-2-C-methyl-D-erythritol kinase n=1 Tax=Proteinivorax hydrogeniformans TaxID=1826727 RepID=A0AAU8HU05_9FIRM